MTTPADIEDMIRAIGPWQLVQKTYRAIGPEDMSSAFGPEDISITIGQDDMSSTIGPEK
ncbi:hypothetical protein CHS0354_005592, partial [Potamilus streckersoni]